MNIIIGIFGIVACFLLIKYRRHVLNFTGPGPWSFLDRFLGAGHASFTYVLVVLFLFFFSIGYMTGTFDTVFDKQVTELVAPEAKNR